jgi:hypothetical protein
MPSMHLFVDIACNRIDGPRMRLLIDRPGSSIHKFPSVLRSVHCHTNCQVLDKLFIETFFEFKKSRATGLLVSVTPKPVLLRESPI